MVFLMTAAALYLKTDHARRHVQNAINQAKMFTEAVQVTGIMLAKLDGTAKGGIVIAIRNQVNLPVKFVGLGEKPEDIEAFDPETFVEALFS